MKFSVAANYDLDLIPRLKGYPVEEMYGKLPWDFVGGGRPSYMGTPVTRRELAEYVSCLKANGIGFNYLLNAACLGNAEWTRTWQRKLMAFLNELGNMGVATLTVSTPYLLELVKKRFPGFAVKVGIYAQVDTPRRARFWEDLGADAINLESFSINRNLGLLADIRKAVACELVLIPNHACLVNCAMQPYHQNGFAHSSNGSGGLFVDYCLLRCSRSRLRDPSSFIKAQWIRPEDIGAYERMGYSHFKLLERGIPSDEIFRRVKAYSDRRYDGNLADLVLSYGFREAPRTQRLWAFRNFFRPLQANPFALRGASRLARQEGMLSARATRPVVIDASQLPSDFLDAFRTRDCARLACGDCGYCEAVAARAVRVNPADVEEALRLHDDVHEALLRGRPWGV